MDPLRIADRQSRSVRAVRVHEVDLEMIARVANEHEFQLVRRPRGVQI